MSRGVSLRNGFLDGAPRCFRYSFCSLLRVNLAFLRALSQRDFGLLWIGQTISLLGDGIFTIALAWQALELSGDPRTLGLVLLTRSGGRLVILLLGGAVADRIQRRLLLLIGDLIQAVAVGSVAVLTSAGNLQVWHLIILAAITGAGSGIFLAASTALVPQLVSEDFLPSANSLTSTSRLLTGDLLGPAVGGLVVSALGTAMAFFLDAASFLASVVALVLIRPRELEAGPRARLLRGMREGFSYVRQRPWLWVTLLAVGTVGNFVAFGPLSVLVPLLIRGRMGAGADALGLAFAGFGAGGVAAAVLVGSIRLPERTIVPALLGWTLSSLAIAALGIAPNVLAVAVLIAVAGFCSEGAQVVWVTLLQKFVPERLLGRVTSIDWFVSLSLQPLGVGLAGAAAGILGVGGALMAGGLLAAAADAVGFLRAGVRRLNPL